MALMPGIHTKFKSQRQPLLTLQKPGQEFAANVRVAKCCHMGTVVHAVKDGSEAVAGAAAVESSILNANAGPAGPANRLSVALRDSVIAVAVVSGSIPRACVRKAW
jgi:hypothetical protein